MRSGKEEDIRVTLKCVSAMLEQRKKDMNFKQEIHSQVS
jgi:hypothetical protein